MNISGAIALVTGANRGIGLGYVQGLLVAGVSKIYACGRDMDSLRGAIALDADRVLPIQLDLSEPGLIEKAATNCQDTTLLINNAGIGMNQGFLTTPDIRGAELEMTVNYFGVLRMCRAFAPVLKRNGGGTIVNTLSILSLINLPASGSYCASKAAAYSMTQAIRAELAAQGTLVIAALPGTVDTDMAKYAPPPKMPVSEVVREVLEAIAQGTEEVYPGEQAKSLIQQLRTDPKAVEKFMATMLPH